MPSTNSRAARGRQPTQTNNSTASSLLINLGRRGQCNAQIGSQRTQEIPIQMYDLEYRRLGLIQPAIANKCRSICEEASISGHVFQWSGRRDSPPLVALAPCRPSGLAAAFDANGVNIPRSFPNMKTDIQVLCHRSCRSEKAHEYFDDLI